MSSDRQGTAYVAQIPHQVPQSHYYQQNPNMMPPHNPPILSMNPQHQRQISAGLAVPPLVQSSSQSASYNQGQLPSNSISQVSYENTSSHMTMPQTPHMSLPQISQMPTAQTFNMPPSSHMKTAHISTSYIPAAQVPQMSVAQPYHLPAASHAPLAPMTTSYVSAPINTPLSNNSYSSSEAYSSSGLSIITLPSMPLALYEPPQYMSQMNPVLDKYYRPTMQVLPNQPSILSKMKVPLGVTITPFLDSELFSNENVGVLRVPVVGGSIQRCRKCRAYINPYVEWYDSGSRYKCNLCFFVNDIPSDYDFDARTQKSIPRKERAELFEPVVEFMAPAEYMVRAPQANIFFFILDVSYGAISNGILPVLARTLLSGLDNLPNSDGRTKVGFCLVDDSVTFVSFNLAMNEPQLLVIPRDEDSEKDSSGPFLPRPEDLLVNLTDSRYQLESFLTKLPTLYYNRTSARQPIVGTALLSAHKLLGPIGGKIVVFLSTLPGLDKGELKFRDEASLIGTEKESSLLQPSNKFYKDLAVEFSKDQIAVDLFLTPMSFIDVSSLAPLSRFTSGKVFYYPCFKSTFEGDIAQFTSDLLQFMSLPVSWEAVLRVRASKGIVVSGYYGNFFIRQTDLLTLANVNPTASYTVEFSMEESLAYSTAYIQTALLHTNCRGERKIRVLTMPLRITPNIGECYSSLDVPAIIHLMAENAIELLLSNGAKLETVRDELVRRGLDILLAIQSNLQISSRPSEVIMVPHSLKTFPLLLLAVLKSVLFRGGSPRTSADTRAMALSQFKYMSVQESLLLFYPTLYPLHNLPTNLLNADKFYFPRPLSLSTETIQRHGCYLLDIGGAPAPYLWIGSQIDAGLYLDLFGANFQPFSGKVLLPELDTQISKYLHRLLRTLYTNVDPGHRHCTPCPLVFVVKEDPQLNMNLNSNLNTTIDTNLNSNNTNTNSMVDAMALKVQFLAAFMEDRSESAPSYPLFLTQIRDKLNTK